MDRQEVELLAIGAGPANLALAVALEELAPEEFSTRALIVEQHPDVLWQRGMLLPWSRSQVSFLKDLVTLRNPRSEFSFLRYLHSVGRLDRFINLGSVTPYRLEFSGYLQWVARSLAKVRTEYGRRVVSIRPAPAGGTVTRWVVRLADGGTVTCRHLVVGAGRDPHVPPEFAQVPREQVIHSTEFAARVGSLDRQAPYRVVVLGGAQSGAEMLWATHQEFPNSRCTMVMRSVGLNNYEHGMFTNELYYPSYVDTFYAARPEARLQVLREMHRTNYSALEPYLLDAIYRQMYVEELTGDRRLRMITMSEVTAARTEHGEVVLTLTDRKTGRRTEERCDLVLLGTGFVRTMPKLARDLAAAAGVTEITVDRHYRMNLPPSFEATCHLQGVNETTHGIADSLLSVLAVRSGEIVSDLLATRTARVPALAIEGAR